MGHGETGGARKLAYSSRFFGEVYVEARSVSAYAGPLGGLSGIEVWGTARAGHAVLIRGLGATPIDYEREDFTVVLPGGFDIVFDGTGENGCRRSFEALKPAARPPSNHQARSMPMDPAKNDADRNQQSLEDRVQAELEDSLDEELELELGDDLLARLPASIADTPQQEGFDRRRYFTELLRLQRELIKLQDWVVDQKLKVVVLFEGRDAAGKGGVIKRVMQRLNPRICRTVALSAPTERERTQWYFQRYVSHLPGAGEIVLFDRSWYNRAGVERVMGFCSEADVEEFFRTVPEFERMLVRSGIILLKYWFSITDPEQNLRFHMRIHDPLKQWKLSPMDLQSRRRWEEYTKAKEEMLARTHIAEAPWWVVDGNDNAVPA